MHNFDTDCIASVIGGNSYYNFMKADPRYVHIKPVKPQNHHNNDFKFRSDLTKTIAVLLHCREIQLMFFIVIMAVNCEEHREHINTVCGQDADLL
jgi:hypothetical protein